jgi:hypothetical protein
MSIKTVYEVVRWEGWERGEGLRLSNNHHAYYARLWLENNPDHPDLFRLKSLREKY